jgi:tubulin-specific chaperone D
MSMAATDLPEKLNTSVEQDCMDIKFNADLLDFVQEIIVKADINERALELNLQKFDEYQQIPKLLDPYLGRMIGPLQQWLISQIQPAEGANTKPNGIGSNNAVFKTLYRIIKTRGWKATLPHFDNSVHLLEPALDALDSVEKGSWESRYIMLLWLSLLIMTPFDLTRIESQPGLFNRILTIAQKYTKSVGIEYQAASILLMRLLTR